MNCAELVYVVFSRATKLSSKIPKPNRHVVTVKDIASTKHISNVRNFRRMSAIKIWINLCVNGTFPIKIPYQNKALIEVHCMLSESAKPNTTDTYIQQCRKKF